MNSVKFVMAFAIASIVLSGPTYAKALKRSNAVTTASHVVNPDGCEYTNSGRVICLGKAPAEATKRVKVAGGYQPTYRRVKTAPKPLQSVDANGSPVAKATAPETFNFGVRPNGMISVRSAYGFPIVVHPAYANKFLKLFASMKEHGYVLPRQLPVVYCWAPGGHIPGSNHYIGAACDVQWGWNRGPDFVYTAEFNGLVKAAGLYNGCSFGDCGHIEAVRGAFNRSPNLYASLQKFQQERLEGVWRKVWDYNPSYEEVVAETTTELAAKSHESALQRQARNYYFGRVYLERF